MEGLYAMVRAMKAFFKGFDIGTCANGGLNKKEQLKMIWSYGEDKRLVCEKGVSN